MKELNKSIKINNLIIHFKKRNKDKEYISLTDMAKWKNKEFPADVVKNWMRTKYTIQFLGIWEIYNNPTFKLVEFNQFKNEAGERSFVLSLKKWINETKAIGIYSRSGKYSGGTYAHKDIAKEKRQSSR